MISLALLLLAAVASHAQTISCGLRVTIVDANAVTLMNELIAKLTNQSTVLRQAVNLTNNASMVVFGAPYNGFFPADSPRCPRYDDPLPQCTIATFENTSIPNECYPLVIGDRVFEDENANSEQNNLLRRGSVHPSDDPDTGYRNVTLYLYDQWGALLDTTKSSNTGYYYFGLPGQYQLDYNTTYIVTIVYNVTGNAMFERFYTPTTALTGSNLTDSNGVFSASPSRVSANITTPTRTSGIHQDFSLDFGFVCSGKYTVSGNAFIDYANDGFYNATLGDSVKSGLTVFLYTYDDESVSVAAAGATKVLVATTITNALGVWSFTSPAVTFVANTSYAAAIDRAQYYDIEDLNVGMYTGSNVSTEESCIDNDAHAYTGWSSSPNASQSAAVIFFQTTAQTCSSFVCKSFGFFDCSAADIGAAISYTGNSTADFAALGPTYAGQWISFSDGMAADVGLPPAISAVTNSSGLDVSTFYVAYSSQLDRLYLAVTCMGICGDVDNDGDPGGTSSELTGLGGYDAPDLQQTETILLFIDANSDGMLDYAIGTPPGRVYNASAPCPVRGDITCTGVYKITASTGSNIIAMINFENNVLSTLPVSYFCNPSSSCRDFQITVDRFSTLPLLAFDERGIAGFRIRLFVGSFDDDGIGEDIVPGSATAFFSVQFPCPPVNVSTEAPFDITAAPTPMPPTVSPTPLPTPPPGSPTMAPTEQPTPQPTFAGYATFEPTRSPTTSPTKQPSNAPTPHPTVPPGSPSPSPTQQPTRFPTPMPTILQEANDCCFDHDEGCSSSAIESCVCAFDNYCCDTHWDVTCVQKAVDECGLVCSYVSYSPSQSPTVSPSRSPTKSPTRSPTLSPSRIPTNSPTRSPTKSPTRSPSNSPTRSPTLSPTRSPTNSPTISPTKSPTRSPTFSPTKSPTQSPTLSPTLSVRGLCDFYFISCPTHPRRCTRCCNAFKYVRKSRRRLSLRPSPRRACRLASPPCCRRARQRRCHSRRLLRLARRVRPLLRLPRLRRLRASSRLIGTHKWQMRQSSCRSSTEVTTTSVLTGATVRPRRS